MEIVESLGSYLISSREKRQLNRKQLAEKLDISESLIGKYERNVQRPSRTMLENISNVLAIDMEDLVKYWLGGEILERCMDEKRQHVELALEYVQDHLLEIWHEKGEGDEIYPLFTKKPTNTSPPPAAL